MEIKIISKQLILAMVITLMPFIFLTPIFSQAQPTIDIEQIESDEYIRGRIVGLNPEEYSNHKVIVYVKTDKWYIHPYERGGEGKSYATIKEDGTWTITTVKREFLADYVVALLVRSDYNPPSEVQNLGEIEYIAKQKEKGEARL